jgi:hypothetical protein
MKYFTIKKILTLGIIALFIGASVVIPNIQLFGSECNIYIAQATEPLDNMLNI